MTKGRSMSDADVVAPAGEAISGMAASGVDRGTDFEPTAGTLLREAREAAGIHIAALAVSLKVPVKKLEALELDRFDLLPDAVFVRALASSVCRSLKLDAAPVLERLPQTSAPKLIYQGAGINAPFRSPGEGPRPAVWTQVSKPAVLAGLALLLGALVLIFLPVIKPDATKGQSDSEMQAGGAEAAKPLPAAVAMTGGGLVNDAKPVFPTEQSHDTFSGAGAATVAGSPAGPAVTTTTSLPGPAVQPAPVPVPSGVAAPVSPAAPAGIVTFRARGESWVEVTDAKGTVVLRRTLTAGEVAGASGALPLAAVVGKADVTQVQVRGQAFDLSSVARDNVARFEVK